MEDCINTCDEGRVKKAKRMKSFISFAAGMAGLLFGLDIGVISGALPFITTHFELTSRLQEWVVSTMMLRSEERRVGKECRSRWSPYH